MKPIGPLMWEHRIIERMVRILEKELKQIKKTDKVNTTLLLAGVDFFKTYADRTHHGKEEDILFRDLATKELSPAHKKIMDNLVKDHVLARKTVRTLLDATGSFTHENTQSLKDIISALETLVALYPKHIYTEDKEFFYPCMQYFNQEEQDSMIQEFYEFDKEMIHEKYTKMVQDFET